MIPALTTVSHLMVSNSSGPEGPGGFYSCSWDLVGDVWMARFSWVPHPLRIVSGISMKFSIKIIMLFTWWLVCSAANIPVWGKWRWQSCKTWFRNKHRVTSIIYDVFHHIWVFTEKKITELTKRDIDSTSQKENSKRLCDHL